MEGIYKTTVKKRLLAAVLAVFLAVVFPLPEMMGTSRVLAAGNTAEIANVVIYVKFQDDTKDIFNATNGSFSNWQAIKKMYDTDQDSFSNYIQTVTEGKVHVTNYFPQEQSGGQQVQTLVIPRSNDGNSIVNAVVNAFEDGTISMITTDKLDNRETGILDNLTVIVQGDVADSEKGKSAFKSVYAGTEKVNGLWIRNYNMIPSALLVLEKPNDNVLPQQGVIAHEFLHTLGLPDLYRNSGGGDPVGRWDIMASVSCLLQYPLSYLRARQGWISPVKTIDHSGTYTLTTVSESGGDKVFALKTPVSDSELICLEYRKKATDPNRFDYNIPTSGLLMYRVDNKVDGLTNNAGKNYIYVYRPGVTHPEAATDGTTNQAALDVTAGETSYGTTDLTADFTQDTLYYSDGSNSGIRISDVKLSSDQSMLTFTVTFADYSQFGVWDKLDEGISGQFSDDPDICIDPATGTIYAVYAESLSGNLSATQVRVMRWNGTGWQQVGTTIDNAQKPVLTVCGGEVYLSYRKGDWKSVVYCKLSGNAWGQVATCAAQYPGSMQFVVDGNEIYGAFQEDSGSGKRLVIYDIKEHKTVTNSLTTSMDFSNPAVIKSGNSFYVACAEFPSGSAQIREYNMSAGGWSTVYTIAGTFTNTHAIVKQGQKIYAFAGYPSIPGSSGGGTACMAMFDGNSWSSSSVTSMKQFNSVSMDVLEGQVYLAYYDTADKKARLLRGTGTVLEQYSDQLGIGLDFLQIRGYGDSIYAAVKAENTNTMVVRKKAVTQSSVTPPEEIPAPGVLNGWVIENGIEYWYENGIKQGTEGRGKEIYDPGTDAWYWLDAVDGGKKAVSKDVYQESKADDAGTIGKWVRYDEKGHMIKGWDTNEKGTYYFDPTYGTMAKGNVVIDGLPCFFDMTSGIGVDKVWITIDGIDYWYENGKRQGYDPYNAAYRGKEIYDPASDAWYWLDNVDQGKKAVSKDVYQESDAGTWAKNSDGTGKWVRYDENGHMIKGWDKNANGTYYFDLIYGTMAKGTVEIDGVYYTFDLKTGILLRNHSDASF